MSCKRAPRSTRAALLATTMVAIFLNVFFITFFSINSLRENKKTKFPHTSTPTLPTIPTPTTLSPNTIAPTPMTFFPTTIAPTLMTLSPTAATPYTTLSPTIAPTSSQTNYIDVAFLLKSAINNTYCLDVKGGSTEDFTRLQLYQCLDTASQKFYFDSDDRLRSKLSPNICVEMDRQYDVFVHSACVDQWEVDDRSQPGNILLKNIGDDMCMASETSSSSDVTNGTPIIREDCGAYNYNAGFQIITSFALKSTIDNAYCLDVKGGSTVDFTPLQLYECNGTDAQKLYFDSDGRLRSQLSSNICVEMDPQYDVFVHSACVDQWEVDDWSQPGNILLKNIGDDMCMASEASSSSDVTNGTPIIREGCGAYNSNAGFEIVW